MSQRSTSQTTAIVGLGISGMSCLRHLASTDSLVVIDNRTSPANLAEAKRLFPEARFFVGEDAARPERWQGVERFILSPGVAANDPMLEGSDGLPRLSDIDLFMTQAEAPVVGITGTNGKSTVTALLGHIIEELGIAVRIGGNLGEPALDLLSDSAQLYVLELSSFQLEHSHDLELAAATVLNLSADHLDRHGNIANYAAIKRRIYAAASLCVSNADDLLTQPEANAVGAAYRETQKRFTFGAAESADWRLVNKGDRLVLEHNRLQFAQDTDFSLSGRHNMLNVLAAFALVAALELPNVPSFRCAPDRYVAAAANFSGLSHRAEFVRELRGVRYVNDSKATNVGASVAALAGYAGSSSEPDEKTHRSVVLLAGGQGKQADFTPLGPAAGRCVKVALLYGEDAEQIECALAGYTNVQRFFGVSGFDEAVAASQQIAEAGDTVLLAPACASFDMFASFSARGERFRELVEALA